MGIEQTYVIHRLYDRFTQDHKQVFFFLGPNPGIGVTYCCLDIAKSAVDLLANLSVLLIDMNIHKPSLSKMNMGIDRGWTTWLAEEKRFPLSDVIFPWSEPDHLSFLPTGHIKNYREVAIQMQRWLDVFDVLKKKFDLILVDIPAFYQGAEARIFCKKADDILVVIEADGTRKPIANEMVNELRSMEASILGVLFNKRQFHIPRWIYRRFF